MKNSVIYKDNGEIAVTNKSFGNYFLWTLIFILTLLMTLYAEYRFCNSIYIDIIVKLTAPFLFIFLHGLFFKITGISIDNVIRRYKKSTYYFSLFPRKFIINNDSIICKSYYLIIDLNRVIKFDDLPTIDITPYSLRIIKNDGIDVLINFDDIEDSKKASQKIVNQLKLSKQKLKDKEKKESIYRFTLFEAIEMGNFNLVKELLSKGAKINQKNDDGKTPLILAVQKNEIEIIDFLISYNAKLDLIDNDGMTALNFAILNSNDKVIRYLINAEADK